MRPSSSSGNYRPGGKIDDWKTRFQKINAFVMARGGWIVSIPGAGEITMECLPDSTLRDDLRQLGYDVQPAGAAERILPTAIVQHFVRNADGTLGVLTDGSTKPVTAIVHRAGIVRVDKFNLHLT